MNFFLSVIGMVMIIEGLPYFAAPKQSKEILEQIINLEDKSLRKIGIVLMAGGLAILYLSKKI